MATILKLSGVNAVSGGVLNLNGANAGMATIELLPGWRPGVSKRTKGALGTIYTNVTERIPLRISGTSIAECVAAMDALVAAIDQAAVWRTGFGSVTAVTLQYAIDGTSLANPLEVAVLGTPDKDANILDLPVTFNQNLQVFEVNPVTLPFERRGRWLGDAESEVSSSAAENPVINTASFSGTLTVPSPVKLNIEFTSGNGHNTDTGEALAFISDDASKLYISTTLVGFTTGGSSSVITNNHADADASASEVLQIVPNDTNEIQVRTATVGALPNEPGGHIYMMLVVLRNLSSSIYWDINRMQYFRADSTSNNRQTADFSNVRVTPDNNNPQIVKLGPIALDHPIDLASGREVDFFVQPSAGSGVGHELEIDTMGIVELGAGTASLALRDINYTNTNNHVVLDHSLLSLNRPSVHQGSLVDLADIRSLSHEGVPLIFNNADEIACLVLGIQDGNWLLGHSNSGSFVPVDVSIKATRRPAYLVPR